MLQLVFSFILSLIAVGCGAPRYVDYFPYHDDGTVKPKVAFVQISDSSQCNLPWDFSEEVFDGLYYELMDKGEFYVVSPREIGPGWQKRDAIDFFGNQDYSYVQDFQNTDFIIAMEILERSVVACDPCHPNNLNLTVRIRIKILDIRCCEPKIVLYEVFKTCYSGIRSKACVEEGICWRNDYYPKSFCGLAHQRVIKTLANRLDEVIWSVK